MKLEETLNGGYGGLYGEVVTEDTYKLKQLAFIPDVVFDCGANVGIFSRYARTLFPNALIVAIEPDKENYANLVKFTESDNNMILSRMAIGKGRIYRVIGRINGSHESYLNNPNGECEYQSDAHCIMPDFLIQKEVKPEMKSIFKLDIEGNEEIVWEHKPSMEALKRIDYFTGEIHYTMLTGKAAEESRQKSLEALHSFDDTHNVLIEGTSFWLTKK